ncbi:MAG: phosphoribosylamine--glycine ligase [Sphaerochaetaceae bacterium]
MKHLLLIGSGAREHAIAQRLASSRTPWCIHCVGTTDNPGIAALCEDRGGTYRKGSITDPGTMAELARSIEASLAIIGPEAPLETGVADALRQAGIPVVGPDKALARIETSKSFAREFLRSILSQACPRFHIVHDIDEATVRVRDLHGAYVIKADGLTGGKGVLVAGEHLYSDEEAIAYCRSLLKPVPDTVQQPRCVIEEKLEGEEFSLMTVTDGKTFLHLPPVQDHKRAFDGDTGPNTGGMGSYSDRMSSLPFLTPRDLETAKSYNETVIRELEATTGSPYRGILYGGFMATANGIQIIEYNARFGDPECLNLMLLIQSDVLEMFERTANGTLADYTLELSEAASVCVYLVPQSYPMEQTKGEPVHIGVLPHGISVCLGSVEETGSSLVTAGSRTLAFVALGDTIGEARNQVMSAISSIKGKLRYRSDIGSKQLVEKRINHMRQLRNPLRIAIIGSTNGTDMEAIVEQIGRGTLPASIELVLSDRKDAGILHKAQAHGIPNSWIASKGAARDREITRLCEDAKVETIVLIGYMRILGAEFCERWNNRVMNVHPSLLPEFAGTKDTDTHTLAIDRMHKTGNAKTGCTVHLVTSTVDAGPILKQKTCLISPDDTPGTLKKRIQQLEGEALCECLSKAYAYRGDLACCQASSEAPI